MIKVEVRGGHVNIKDVNGNEVVLMSELCCLVKAVCIAYSESEDEIDSKGMAREMVLLVADALKHREEIEWGADHEDD